MKAAHNRLKSVAKTGENRWRKLLAKLNQRLATTENSASASRVALQRWQRNIGAQLA
jgi:predicted DNA-binding ribbon-helix-helix protein